MNLAGVHGGWKACGVWMAAKGKGSNCPQELRPSPLLPSPQQSPPALLVCTGSWRAVPVCTGGETAGNGPRHQKRRALFSHLQWDLEQTSLSLSLHVCESGVIGGGDTQKRGCTGSCL